MNLKLKEKIKESLSAVLPITGIVLMLSIFLVPMELGSIVMFLTGAVMLIVGMGFFQLGAEMAMTPIGEGVGVQISKMKKLITVLLTGFVMGVIITVSEPDLQVLAGQVPSVPNAVLIMTVAIGVGLFLALLRFLVANPCFAVLSVRVLPGGKFYYWYCSFLLYGSSTLYPPIFRLSARYLCP